MLIKAVFIWPNIQKKNGILWDIITTWNNDFLFEYSLKYNLFLWSKAEFSASLLQFSVSHDPSEIILWFIINVEILFSGFLMNKKIKRTGFIQKRDIF